MSSLLRNFSLRAAAPNLAFAASVTLTTVALHFSPRLQRRFFLIPVLILNAIAVLSIDGPVTTWGPAGLDSVTGMISCFYTLAAPLILCVHKRSVFLELDVSSTSTKEKEKTYHRKHPTFVLPSKHTISSAWRIWNNPRALRLANKLPQHQNLGRLLEFGFLRICKMLAINLADRLVVQPFAAYIDSGNFIEHYAPDQEILLRRVIFRDSSVFEPQVVSLRAVTAIWWVWNSVRALETGHAILAVISVCILRLDDPSDWPPLYGSPFEAYTVRRFWGKFWHNCMVPSAWEWASRVAQTLGLRKGSSSEKSFAAFGIFLVSGISHAVVAWKIREGEALRDVMFFVANYGIIVVERLVSSVFRNCLRALRCDWILKIDVVRGLGRVIGLLWVYSWFFWMTPRWLYPKFYLWSLQIQHVEPMLA